MWLSCSHRCICSKIITSEGRQFSNQMAAYGNGNRHQYSAWRIPWMEQPDRLQPMGRKESDTVSEWLTLIIWLQNRSAFAVLHTAARGKQWWSSRDLPRDSERWPGTPRTNKLTGLPGTPRTNTLTERLVYKVSSTLHYFSGTWEAQPLCHPTTVYRTSTGKTGCSGKEHKRGN